MAAAAAARPFHRERVAPLRSLRPLSTLPSRVYVSARPIFQGRSLAISPRRSVTRPVRDPTGPRPAPVRVLHHSATRTTPRPACEASISSGPAIAASPAITQLDPDRQPAILSSPAISGSRPSYVARPSHAVRPDSSSPPSLAARTPRHALTTVPRHSLPVVPQHSTKPRAEFSLRLRGF